MEIELKNGEKLNIEISSLILEYIEDYEGGLEQLLKDAEGRKDYQGYTRTMYAVNHLLYCIVASNYDKEITKRQAIKLIKLEDLTKIITFARKELEKFRPEEIARINYNRKHTM